MRGIRDSRDVTDPAPVPPISTVKVNRRALTVTGTAFEAMVVRSGSVSVALILVVPARSAVPVAANGDVDVGFAITVGSVDIQPMTAPAGRAASTVPFASITVAVATVVSPTRRVVGCSAMVSRDGGAGASGCTTYVTRTDWGATPGTAELIVTVAV
jgi:hypothetical protein